jgi:hypothetical protein
MSRLVVLCSYSDVLRKGPVSLGFSRDSGSALPAEADVTFVVECNESYPCSLDLGGVISASCRYGELSLGLADLMNFDIGLDAEGAIDTLDFLFSPADTPSSTKLTITGASPHAGDSDTAASRALLIQGNDRETGEHFEYAYLAYMQSASRVPVQSIHHLNSGPATDTAARR